MPGFVCVHLCMRAHARDNGTKMPMANSASVVRTFHSVQLKLTRYLLIGWYLLYSPAYKIGKTWQNGSILYDTSVHRPQNYFSALSPSESQCKQPHEWSHSAQSPKRGLDWKTANGLAQVLWSAPGAQGERSTKLWMLNSDRCSRVPFQHSPLDRGWQANSEVPQQKAQFGTLVMPKTPMLGLEEVEPFPVPSKPAIIQEIPSVKIPLGGTGGRKNRNLIDALLGLICFHETFIKCLVS